MDQPKPLDPDELDVIGPDNKSMPITAATIRLAAEYSEMVKKAGYAPRLIGRQDVVSFKRETLTFVILPSADDIGYFRLLLPNIYECKGEADTARINAILVSINRDIKATKAAIVDNRVFIAVEMFVPSVEFVGTVFDRCVRCIVQAAAIFAQQTKTPEK